MSNFVEMFHVLQVQVVALVREKIRAQGPRLGCYLVILFLVAIFMYRFYCKLVINPEMLSVLFFIEFYNFSRKL